MSSHALWQFFVRTITPTHVNLIAADLDDGCFVPAQRRTLFIEFGRKSDFADFEVVPEGGGLFLTYAGTVVIGDYVGLRLLRFVSCWRVHLRCACRFRSRLSQVSYFVEKLALCVSCM